MFLINIIIKGSHLSRMIRFYLRVTDIVDTLTADGKEHLKGLRLCL